MIEIDIYKKLHGSSGDMELRVKLDIRDHEFVALTGHSGSGKSTLLRIIAGLEKAEGSLRVDGIPWLDTHVNLPTQKREIGFVFQEYALFPNMSVEDNLLFVVKDRELATKLLDMTELNDLKDRMPNSLSGGQKQRVALCRAMMSRPKLLLLDEPLSALDPRMRNKLQVEILTLHREFGTTTIMVSHDPSEIYKLSNHAIELHHGEVVRYGNSREILMHSQGSQKFSFEGEILEIKKADVIYVAIISIGQQIVEVVITKEEADRFVVGDIVTVGTKAFAPTINRR